MSTVCFDNGASVRIAPGGGILFRHTIEGAIISCIVPAAEWRSAWAILKQVKTESDVRQWSYIDENHQSMVLCESFIAYEKNVHQVKFVCRVVRLLHTIEFIAIKKFSESKGKSTHPEAREVRGDAPDILGLYDDEGNLGLH